MPSQLLRRGARAAAVAALAFVTIVSGAGASVAASSPDNSPIEITVNAAGIHAPDSSQGGLVSFRIKTDDPNGRQLQILRPNKGVSIDRVLHDLAAVASHTPSTAAAGIRAVRDEAEALGGALVTAQVHEQVTEQITPGTVYLLDLTAFLANPGKPVVKTLELRGTNGMSGNIARFPGGIVIQHRTDGGPRFQTEDVTNVHLAYLVHNDSTELQEMRLQPVKPGTTTDQVQAYFDAVTRGNPPPPSPFTGPSTGLGALSPDHTALIQAHGLKPGTYVLLCLIPSERSGTPQAFLGMHEVVDLR